MTPANIWVEVCEVAESLPPDWLGSWLEMGRTMATVAKREGQEQATKLLQDGNVVHGPWGAAGEVRS